MKLFAFPASAKPALALCAMLSFAVAAHAGTPTPPKKRQPPKVVYQAIASVDEKAMTITVEPKNTTSTSTKTFKFTAKTKITANGHDGTVADLKPGQQIRVSAGADPDIAEELTVTPPPADPK